MNSEEFYDYITDTFDLDGTSGRLVRNIIEYVADQCFVDAEDAHTHLQSLLDGAFGIEKQEIEMYNSCESI